jgi:HAD superfamily hydrolase (TIGR01509 family)
LHLIQQNRKDIFLVTGSGQKSLLNKLEHSFPSVFQKDKMVTAYDVKRGKPDPEPYLMALQKGGLLPEQAIVIENAPLGVKSAVAAGIFTIAVNTGILKDEELLQAGANCLYHDMMELRNDLLLFFSPS